MVWTIGGMSEQCGVRLGKMWIEEEGNSSGGGWRKGRKTKERRSRRGTNKGKERRRMNEW